MADAWITFNKTEGNGNDTVTVNCAEHTGTERRTTEIVVKLKNIVDLNKKCVVTQEAAEINTYYTSESNIYMESAGGINIPLEGYSNSERLEWTVYIAGLNGRVEITDEVVSGYTIYINGERITHGWFVKTDKGKQGMYHFKCEIGIAPQYAYERYIEDPQAILVELRDDRNIDDRNLRTSIYFPEHY